MFLSFYIFCFGVAHFYRPVLLQKIYYYKAKRILVKNHLITLPKLKPPIIHVMRMIFDGKKEDDLKKSKSLKDFFVL